MPDKPYPGTKLRTGHFLRTVVVPALERNADRVAIVAECMYPHCVYISAAPYSAVNINHEVVPNAAPCAIIPV